MRNTFTRAILAGVALGTTVLIAPAIAAPHGEGMGNSANHPPVTTPVGRPSTPGDTDRGNSGTTPNNRDNGRVLAPATHLPTSIGKPATHGDTDRGHSEGRGHNDRKHRNNRAQRGTVVSVTGTTAVLRLPNGKTRTVTVANPSVLTVGKFVSFKVGPTGIIQIITPRP